MEGGGQGALGAAMAREWGVASTGEEVFEMAGGGGEGTECLVGGNLSWEEGTFIIR
jgi:hypothetical protein